MPAHVERHDCRLMPAGLDEAHDGRALERPLQEERKAECGYRFSETVLIQDLSVRMPPDIE